MHVVVVVHHLCVHLQQLGLTPRLREGRQRDQQRGGPGVYVVDDGGQLPQVEALVVVAIVILERERY